MHTVLVQISVKEIVYEVPCHDCEMKYIGETKRSMKKRVAEHRYAVKKEDVQKWHSSPCSKIPPFHQLGVCQSLCISKWLLVQKDTGGHPDTEGTTHHESGLWPPVVLSMKPGPGPNLVCLFFFRPLDL
jgi:hypothetical protein